MQEGRSLILVRGLNRDGREGRYLVGSRHCRGIDFDVGEIVVPVVPGDGKGEVGVGEESLCFCGGTGDG